jgi:hypothetical protein
VQMEMLNCTSNLNFSSGEIPFHIFASCVMICEEDQSGCSSAMQTLQLTLARVVVATSSNNRCTDLYSSLE